VLRSRRDTRTGRPGPSITFTLGFRVYWCLTPTGKYSGCPHTCDGARTKNLAETIAVLLTDPDSRAMAAHTKAGVGYNIKVAVDAKHKMIVEQTMGGPNSHMVRMFRSDAASRWRRGNIAYIFVWK